MMDRIQAVRARIADIQAQFQKIEPARTPAPGLPVPVSPAPAGGPYAAPRAAAPAPASFSRALGAAGWEDVTTLKPFDAPGSPEPLAPAPVPGGAGGGVPFESLIADAATRHSVEPGLVRAVIRAESGFNPRAVSRAGAQGLMQLMPETARGLGVRDAFDPAQNIEGGTRYLRHLLDQFGDTHLAIAAYNAGPGSVKRYGGVPPFPETQAYVRRVQSYMSAAAAAPVMP